MKYPVQGRITSPFGDRIHPVTKEKKFHNGVDISCPQGSEIVCPADGKVILVDNIDDTSGGVQLVVDHGTFRTGYAHLSKILVKMSERVITGQVVALSGNTGVGTAPHLHFTYTDAKGQKQDPQKYFN